MSKTSVIVTSYIQSQYQAHLTMACLANVTRYTDPEEYELILMSDNEKFPVRDDYKVLKIDKYVKTKDMGYTASMNEGALQANGDVLVFLQNDVFIWENWLKNMRWYIDNDKADCVIPDQMPRSREEVLKLRELDFIESMKYGSRDAGCLMITVNAFQKMGGWDEDLSLLAEREFYERMGACGIRQIDTCKTIISHVMAGSNLFLQHENPDEYEKRMKHDADKLNK